MITVTTTRRWLCFKWTTTRLVPAPAPVAVMSEREARFHSSNAFGH
jgi:hypothetical protein